MWATLRVSALLLAVIVRLSAAENTQYLNSHETGNSAAQASGENAAPVVTVKVPSGPLLSPATFEIEADATDADGTIEEIAAHFNQAAAVGQAPVLIFLGAEATNRLRLTVTNLVALGGTIIVTARDNLGATNRVITLLNIFGLEGDDHRRPLMLGGLSASGSVSNHFATQQTQEPSRSRSNRSLYWRWVAPTNGIAYVSTEGSTFDTDLDLLDVLPDGSLGPRDYNDDFWGAAPSSLLKFEAQAGVSYQFRVGDPVTNVGVAAINVELKTPSSIADSAPANDLFANRQVLSGENIRLRVSNHGATAEPGETGFGRIAPANSLWFAWTAPRDGTALVATSGSDFDPRVSVRPDGENALSAGLSPGSDDAVGFESYVQFQVASNATYAISLDGFGGVTGSTDLIVQMISPAQATNDNFAESSAISGTDTVTAGGNIGATVEAGEPPLPPTLLQGKTTWWKWTAAENSRVWLSARGRTNATWQPVHLDVFSGVEVANLTKLAEGRNWPAPSALKTHAAFQATAGRTYHVRVTSLREYPRVELALHAVPAGEFTRIESIVEENGAMLIKVSGATPETRLELSPNLVNWGPVEAPMLEEGTFAVPKNNSPGRRFFRTVR